MCRLTKEQYHLCTLCRDDMKELLKTKEPDAVLDALLEKYNIRIIDFVLTATIKNNGNIKGNFSSQTIKWAERYYNTIGFLGENIKLTNASKFKVEALCMLAKRRN